MNEKLFEKELPFGTHNPLYRPTYSLESCSTIESFFDAMSLDYEVLHHDSIEHLEEIFISKYDLDKDLSSKVRDLFKDFTFFDRKIWVIKNETLENKKNSEFIR